MATARYAIVTLVIALLSQGDALAMDAGKGVCEEPPKDEPTCSVDIVKTKQSEFAQSNLMKLRHAEYTTDDQHYYVALRSLDQMPSIGKRGAVWKTYIQRHLKDIIDVADRDVRFDPLALAVAYLRVGDFDKARTLYFQIDPKSVKSVFANEGVQLGIAFKRADLVDSYLSKLDHNDFNKLVYLMNVCCKAGESQQAERFYRLARALRATDSVLIGNYARCLASRGKLDEADAELSRALETADSSPMSWVGNTPPNLAFGASFGTGNRAYLLLHRSDIREQQTKTAAAEDDIRSALSAARPIEGKPKCDYESSLAHVHKYYSEFLQRHGRLAESLEQARIASKLATSPDAPNLVPLSEIRRLFDALIASKQFDEAAAHIDTLKGDPNHPLDLAKIIWLSKTGKQQEAIDLSKRWLEQDSMLFFYPEDAYQLSLIGKSTGRGIEKLTELALSSLGNPTAYYFRAKLYDDSGRPDLARCDYESALERFMEVPYASEMPMVAECKKWLDRHPSK